MGTLLEVGTGFHGELSGRENIYLSGAIMGMSKVEIDRKFDEIVAFAEVEKLIDTPVKHYSSGMYVRLAFAVAAHLEPEILLVDEVLAVGDIAFQKKSLGKMREAGYSGKTVLIVSHNMEMIASTCRRVIWLDGGKCAMHGDVSKVIDAYERSTRANNGIGDRLQRSQMSKKKAWIDWIEVYDDNQKHRTVFKNGEYLNLLLKLEGNFPPASYFEWILKNEKGLVVTSGGTFVKEHDITLPTPTGLLHARIGPLPLAEGTYNLTLRLGILPGIEFLDVWEDATSILITSYVPEPNGIPFDTRRGVIYIPADYSDNN
jgi:lipopolysaccharide transport system ATP-binding protein